MPIAPLDDLLPSLFDSMVLQFTQRALLSVERNAILTALVNGLGEAVMRRVRDAEAAARDAGPPGSKDITRIETFDRFSDEWMSRLEIVESIACSSGLDRSLSELALFLMECRLDSMLSIENSTVVGIGQISPGRSVHEIRPTSQEVFNRLDKALMESFSETPGAMEIWRRLFGKNETKRSAQRLIDEAQLTAMLREPLSYKILLAETLAFKRGKRVPKEIKPSVTDKNRVIDSEILAVEWKPKPPFELQTAPQAVPESRVSK